MNHGAACAVWIDSPRPSDARPLQELMVDKLKVMNYERDWCKRNSMSKVQGAFGAAENFVPTLMCAGAGSACTSRNLVPNSICTGRGAFARPESSCQTLVCTGRGA
eukprot:365852-Chlamydomonas_euryale.AAC.3